MIFYLEIRSYFNIFCVVCIVNSEVNEYVSVKFFLNYDIKFKN